MKILIFIINWACWPLQAAMLWPMTRRCVFKTFPWFFSYTAYSVLANLARSIAFGHQPAQFYTYWATDSVYAILGIAVMYEVFRTVFGGFFLNWWFRLIYPTTVLLTIVLVASYTHMRPAGAYSRAIVRWIIIGEMGVRIIEVATFVLLVVLVFLFGLRWRQHAFGISAGFGLYSTAALLAYTKYYEIGTKFYFASDIINVLAYDVAVLIWLWYFTGPRVPEEARTDPPPLSVHELEVYKEALRKVRRP
jgi:hypothetical protein